MTSPARTTQVSRVSSSPSVSKLDKARPSVKDLASDILETTPLLLREIRSELRLNSETGISLPQFRILAAVKAEAKSNKEIALCLGLSVTTTSRMIQQLVDRGLLEKTIASESRREIRICLSKAGRASFDQVYAEARRNLSMRFKSLSASDRGLIQEAFQILTRALSGNPTVDLKQEPNA